MASYLALRDRRLEGGVPSRPRLNIVNTDAGTPLSGAFRRIHAASRQSGGLHSIFILCHGYEDILSVGLSSQQRGGMGLELGREDVLHTNVYLWEAVKGAARNIVVYSCAASDTAPGQTGTNQDGRYLMGALAIHTGAFVYAADETQEYCTYNDLANGRYDFGSWEGRLLRFPPSGEAATVVGRPPVELNDVFGGSAP